VADLTKTVSIIFQGEDQISVTTDGITKSFKAVSDSSSDATKEVGQLDDELTKVGDTAPSIDKASAALKALAASLIVKDFIDANLAFEKFSQSMTATTGDATKAAAEFEFVREVSNRLGIETRSTADAYAKFAASVKGTSLEGQGARDIFEAFAGTMSRVGSSSADISGAFVQLAQGISKGRFELEDLKSIAERVPGFFDAFSKSLGVTTAELFDMISAGKIGSVEIARFADTLAQKLDGATFDGYAQSFARLRNSIDDAYLIVGNAGAFDVLIKGLQAGTAAVVGTIASFTLLGEIVGAVLAKIANPLSFDLGEAINESFDKAAKTTQAASDALLGVEKNISAAGTAGATAGNQIADGFDKGAISAKELEKAAAEVDKNLKVLGIDPKLFDDPIADIGAAFAGLAKNAAATGEQIVVGLIGALQNLPAGAGLEGLTADIDAAFNSGKLSADEYAQAMALIKVRMDDASPSFLKVADSASVQTKKIDETAKSAEKAEKAARDYALEMEKIASNERIKLIEAVVSINVAQVEAQAKQVVAAFESINVGIESTGDVLASLFDLFKEEGNLSWKALSEIEDQIDRENKWREDSFKLQKELVTAQIENIRAQTAAMNNGDAMIKIDGAGLQPHLEAFMWEILKTIQVRVNNDGLSMLLGV